MSKSTYFTGQPVYSQVIKWYCPKNLHTFSDNTNNTQRERRRYKGSLFRKKEVLQKRVLQHLLISFERKCQRK